MIDLKVVVPEAADAHHATKALQPRTRSMSATLSHPEAVFERIRANITTSFECLRAAFDDIVLVHRQQLWTALGYASFEDCLETELAIERFALKRTERRQAVAFLDAAGLTTRAIAASVGASQTTIVRDLATNPATDSGGSVLDLGHQPRSSSIGASSRRKVGLDGKSRPTRRSASTSTPDLEPAMCLTPKAANVMSAIHEFASFLRETKAEERLGDARFEDITDLTFEELQTLADHIYRAKHGVKKVLERVP
jgi:hypothetical protein